jgi:hypothetical protein
VLLLAAVALCFFEWLSRQSAHAFDLARWRSLARWSFYYAMTLLIVGFANVHYVPFIYFDF